MSDKTKEPKKCCGTCQFVERLKFKTQDGMVPLVCVEKEMILVKAHYGKKCPYWKPLLGQEIHYAATV